MSPARDMSGIGGVEPVSVRIYSVVVNRAATASDSAVLSRIELSPLKKRSRAYKLSPEFEAATRRYAVNVRASVTGLKVNAATEHAGSVVDISGQAADGKPLVLDGSQLSGLAVGDNTLEIAVTSEDETTKSYRLVAKRSGSR
ncbi:MAG: cadherin-like beta sandwich domain-containing protein [Acidobacteria bacterium]|nr:cadherin-like beta sandwich domain-containing protein [Acidobacteriota bacterium]